MRSPEPPKPHVMIGIVDALLEASAKRHEWNSGKLEMALDKVWMDLNKLILK